MSTDDAQLEQRLRTTLRTWADEAPVAVAAELPALGASGRPQGPRPPVLGGRRVPLLVAATAVAALVAVLLVLDRPSREAVEVIGQDDLVTSEIRVGDALGVRVLALGEEGLYVASENDRRLYRIDRDTGEVRNGPALAVPDAVRVTDAGVVAVIDDPPRLAQLDPVTLEPERTVALAGEPAGLVVVDDVIWVRDTTGRTARFGAEHLEELDELATGLTEGFQSAGGAGLWRSDPEARTVNRLDPVTGEVLASVDIDGEPRAVVVDDDGVWVADVDGDRVLHIDPEAGAVDRSVDVGRFPHGMALGDGRLWVTNFEGGTLTTIDTVRAEVLTTVPIGVRPGGLVLDGGTLWVAVHQEGLVRAVDPDRLEEASILPTAEAEHEVDLGGRSLFIRCMGSSGAGVPTVLLEAAAGQWSEHQLFVQYGLQSTHRVCAYDRAGLGRSDPGVEPRTAQRIVDDLGAALDAAGIPGPYILVGDLHGGLYARLFAAQHLDEVRGLVLVDSFTPTLIDELRPLLDLRERAELDAGLADPERAGLEESGAQVTAAGPLGDLPMVVVTGDVMLSHLGPDAAELWQRHQRSLLDLSEDSHLVVVSGVTRSVPVDVPGAVVQAVRDVSGRSG